MALPLLNATPSYDLTVPSTGEKFKFRPFLVKEQKVLMLAYESQDKKQIINAMLDIVNACVEGINSRTLATADVDFIFTQLRAKSVGEKIELNIPCEECKTKNNITIDIEQVTISGNNKEKIIELNEQYSVKLKYPTYINFMDNIDDNKPQTEMIMDIIVSCIDSVITEEEIITLKDEPKEEITKFVESMNSKQFEMLTEFVQDIPQIRYKTDLKCVNCEHEQEITLQGLDDFF